MIAETVPAVEDDGRLSRTTTERGSLWILENWSIR
jgi:hypothetical protein